MPEEMLHKTLGGPEAEIVAPSTLKHLDSAILFVCHRRLSTARAQAPRGVVGLVGSGLLHCWFGFGFGFGFGQKYLL